MVGILLMSHGELSKGELNTLECIVGANENITVLTLAADDDITKFEEDMNQAIIELNTGDGVLVMVDVLGGTPSNKSAQKLREKDVEVLTGLNLPMLLAAVEARMHNMSLNDMKKHVIENGQQSIISLREHFEL